MLEIKNLQASINNKAILKGLKRKLALFIALKKKNGARNRARRFSDINYDSK